MLSARSVCVEYSKFYYDKSPVIRQDETDGSKYPIVNVNKASRDYSALEIKKTGQARVGCAINVPRQLEVDLYKRTKKIIKQNGSLSDDVLVGTLFWSFVYFGAFSSAMVEVKQKIYHILHAKY